MTGFNKVMRFCNTLQDYESAKNQGTITDDLFVVILQDKLAKFKGQTFDWSQNADLTALATKGELEALAEEIASNERVWAEALNDLNERINNIGTGGGGGGGTSDIVVDAALSTTSTNAIQNKAVANALNEKQDTISDLATIRANAEKGATALQSVPSEYITDSELNAKGYATTAQLATKQDTISDLEAIRSGAAKGETALEQTGIYMSSTAEVSISYGYSNIIDKNISGGETVTISLDNQNAFVEGKRIAFVSDGFATVYKQFPFEPFDVQLQNNATYVRCSVNPDGISSNANATMIVQVVGVLSSAIEDLSESINDLNNTLFSVVNPTIIEGKYITGTGYIGDTSSSCITDFIYVGDTTRIIIENANMSESRAIVGYDESNTVVTYWEEYTNGDELVLPNNVVSIRLNGIAGVAPVVIKKNGYESERKVEMVADEVEKLSQGLHDQLGLYYSATSATHLSYGYSNRIDQNISSGEIINISLDNQNAFVKGTTIAFVSDGFATVYKQFPFEPFDVQLQNNVTYVRCSVNPNGITSVADVTLNVNIFGIVGYKINALEQKNKDLFKSISRPIITVIDDDTLSYDSIKKFHDVCVSNNIVGTYATLTSLILSDERIIPLMKEYEQSGFHFAYHGDSQSPSYSPEFNAVAAENDFVKGMREMQSANLLDWKFWVIPYGAYQTELQKMAKKWGCKCAVGIGQNAYIKTSEAVNRFYLPRAGFNAQETGSVSFEQLKALIDAAAANNGWVIVGTHIYDGWTDELLNTKFAEMVNYAKNAGLTFVTLNEGYRQFEPYFMYNEMY